MDLIKRSKMALAAFVSLLSIGLPLVTAAPVEAANITGCHLIACFDAFTGAKNYTNHTQLVQQITVFSTGGSGLIETWGDGFYKSGRGSSFTWNINVWAHSGTYVCGAVTVPGVERRIACFAIKV